MAAVAGDAVDTDRPGELVLTATVPAAVTGSTAVRAPEELDCDVFPTDGATVHVRPIRPDDGDRLVEFHERLSPETVYRRFFGARPHLPAAEVERITHVGYCDRLALVGRVCRPGRAPIQSSPSSARRRSP